MLRFLPGLILLQIITVSLLLLAPENLSGMGWLRIGVPLVICAILIAFWFGSLAVQMRHDAIARLKEQHAREREDIKVSAERAKHKVTKDAQKQVEKEIRRTSSKANFKVGAAVAAAVGVGGLLILTQFITLGIMLMTTAGGAMGGYMLRYKHEKERDHLLTSKASDQTLPSKEKVINLPPKKTSSDATKS